MAAQKPKNKALGQLPCCLKKLPDYAARGSAKLVTALAQRINRVRVARCNIKMTRATRAESVMPKMVETGKDDNDDGGDDHDRQDRQHGIEYRRRRFWRR